MKALFRKSFAQDLKKIRDRRTLDKVQYAIANVESAESIQDIINVRKLSGNRTYYRIRIGEYRIGLAIEGEIVEFVRCLHRRDIYRYFP